MVMMGFVNAFCPLASRDTLVETIRGIVPGGTEDLNEQAFDEGVRQAEDLKARNA
jgi:Pyruvate/2-oxoacid:ferredoxin oxidoreductase gamma subunit